MRNAGVFLVPTRFMRIFTDINISKEQGNYHLEAFLQALIFKRKARFETGRGLAFSIAGAFVSSGTQCGSVVGSVFSIGQAQVGQAFVAFWQSTHWMKPNDDSGADCGESKLETLNFE